MRGGPFRLSKEDFDKLVDGKAGSPATIERYQ